MKDQTQSNFQGEIVLTSDLQVSVFTDTFTAWYSSVTYIIHPCFSSYASPKLNIRITQDFWRLPTQNSKLKRSCDEDKWYLRPYRKRLKIYKHHCENILCSFHMTRTINIKENKSEKSFTLKLAHFTKQNGQEKSSVTARQN